MSFVTQVLTQGGGGFDLRVAIEGCGVEFCSTHAMAELLGSGATEDGYDVEGVRRVGGLRREGLSFQESAYLPGAEYRASLGSVSIEDTDETVAWNLRAASSVFSAIPREAAYLSATVDTAETTWSVRSSDGLEVGAVYHIDTEAVRVTAINSSTEIEVDRAVWRTTAQSHYVATSTFSGDATQLSTMWTSPPTYRRRRVWIYAHALSPSTGLVDAGSLIARGIISSAPTLTDASTWSFPLGSLTSLFDADIGPREGAGVITGIYYPFATPFRFSVFRRADATVTSEIDSGATVYLNGFWRDNDEFCLALADALNSNATISAWGVTFTAQSVGGRWELFVQIAASGSERMIGVIGGSAIDGWFNGQLYDPISPEGSMWAGSVSADEVLRCGWTQYPFADHWWIPPAAGTRGVPRAMPNRLGPYTGDPADAATYPWHRLYVGASAGVTAGDVIRVSQDGSDSVPAYTWEATVTEVDTATGAITWDPDTMRGIGGEALTLALVGRSSDTLTKVTPAALPSVTLVRDLGTGHVGDMLQALVADAPELANAGTVPFLLSTDFDSFTTIDAAVREAASGRPWLLSRRYTYSASVRFADLIKHELRMLGAYLATTVTGAITIRPLVPRLDVDHTLASADLMTSDGYGDLIVEPDGTLTGLTVKTGYDSAEDDHKGQEYQVTALGALAAQRQYLALEVAPKSTPTGAEPTYTDLVAHMLGKISLWSRIRFAVTVPVALWHYDALIGDSIFATIPALPYDGERGNDNGGGGIVSVRGTVTGRSWRFAEPSVDLTILFDAIDISGYAPAGRVTAQSGSATTWTLTLDADEYGPGGSVADASFFAVGYEIRLIEWDVDAPTIRTGAVTSVSGNSVGVELDASWTPGSSTWNLHFAQSTTSGLAAAQHRSYAYVSRADWRVHLSSGTEAPDRLTP